MDTNKQVQLLCIFSEIQNLSNETAATLQGGGSAVKVYDQAWNRKPLLSTSSDVPWVGHKANDKISKILITEGTWGFYEHANYKGAVLTASARNRPFHMPWYLFNNRISSFKRLDR